MSARVVPYFPWAQDPDPRLMVECRDCGVEWGWSYEKAGTYDLLQGYADQHNRERHTKTGGEDK